MAARHGRLSRATAPCCYASVVEFIHTATLVHDDIIDESGMRRGRVAVHSRWGTDITVLLGDYLYIKSMAMALTQDIARHRPPAVRRHAADDRGRALPAHQDRRRRHHRRRALRHHPPQDRAPVRRLRADRRHARRRPRRSSRPRCGSTASTSASPSSSSTTCSTTPPTSARSASRSPATCAKARSRCRSSTCSSAAARPRDDRRRHRPRRDVTREQWTELQAACSPSTQSIAKARRQAEHYAERRRAAPVGVPGRRRRRDALLALPDYVLSRDR